MTTIAWNLMEHIAPWIFTVLLHALPWLLLGLLVQRWMKTLAAREIVLKAALFGAFVSAPIQLIWLPHGGWRILESTPMALGRVSQGPVLGIVPASMESGAAISIAGSPQTSRTPRAEQPVGGRRVEPSRLLAGGWLPLASWIWLAGLLAWALREVRNLWRLQRELRDRRPLTDASLRAVLGPIARRAGVARPRLSGVRSLPSPVLLSGREICVPERMAVEMSEGEWRAVLAHEVAHLARRDREWSLATRWASALLWPLPLAGRVRANWEEVAEARCDARAARVAGGLAVARALERVAGWWIEAREEERRLVPAVAMAARGSALVERVTRVLEVDERRESGRAAFWVGLGAFGLGGVLACAGPRIGDAGADSTSTDVDPSGVERSGEEGGPIVAEIVEIPADAEVTEGNPAYHENGDLRDGEVYVGLDGVRVRWGDPGFAQWTAARILEPGEDPEASGDPRVTVHEWMRAVARNFGTERIESDWGPPVSISKATIHILGDRSSDMQQVLRVLELCGRQDVQIRATRMRDVTGRLLPTDLPVDTGQVEQEVSEEPPAEEELAEVVGPPVEERPVVEVQVNPFEDAEPVERTELVLRVVNEGTRLAPDGGAWSGAGRFVYDSDRRLQWQLGPRRYVDLELLGKDVGKLFQGRMGDPLVFDARPGIVYQDVNRTLGVLIDEGLLNIHFVGARR